MLSQLLVLFGCVASMDAMNLRPFPFLSSSSSNNNELHHQSFRTLEEGDDYYFYSWLLDYSLKFYSCHTVTEYSVDENGYGNLWVQRLVKFKLCSVDQCNWNCKGGKYLVQMEDFVTAYADRKEADKKYACQNVLNDCGCGGGDGDEDGDNDCEYNCFVEANLDYCIEEADDDSNELDIRDYAECQELETDDDGEQYYIGLTCANDGLGVNLGIFTDPECMVEKGNGDDDAFKSFPYQDESFVTSDCVTCAYSQYEDEDAENDDDSGSKLSEICTINYDESAKCETYMNIENPDYDACDLIDNIPLGISKSKKSTTAALLVACIFFLSAAFLTVVAMYLVSSAKKRQINLIHEDLHTEIIPMEQHTQKRTFKKRLATVFNK